MMPTGVFGRGASLPRLTALVAGALLWVGCATQAAAPPADPGEEADAVVAALRAEYKALALKNPCPQGYGELQGSWTFMGRSRLTNFSDELRITGTRFAETLRGDVDGKTMSAVLTGEVRCLFKNRVLVMIDKVEPEGAFDNDSGSSYPCDVLSPMSKKDENTVMLLCFFDWDLRPSKGMRFVYGLKDDSAGP